MPSRLFSPEIKQIYSRYPALIRTTTWDRIVALCQKGDKATAEIIAKDTSSRSRQLNAQNVLARKIRINRVQLFAFQTAMASEADGLFADRADALELAIRRLDDLQSAGMPILRKLVAGELAILRRDLNKWMTDGIWQSILLGLRNTENALVDVFKMNEESYSPEIGKERELIEERLSFGLTAPLVGSGKPQLKRGSESYYKTTDALYEKLVKQGTQGLQPSDRIWQLSKSTELELNRILQAEIAAGTSSRDVADKLGEYLSPEVAGKQGALGQGVYKSPLKNAMRLARTETNRAYTNAQAEWAKTRSWVKGMMVTLSPAHDPAAGEDECDAWAGKILDPDEFQERVPFHPHCMCFGTVVIKDEFLSVESEEAVHA